MKQLCMGCMKEYDSRFDICPYCGYAVNTPPKQSYHIRPGSLLAQRYIVGKVLGYGGFGVTYVGWDKLMERKVAIKEYLPSEFATRMPTQQKITVYSGDKAEQFKEGLVKTLEEAKRLAKFEAVSGIVQIYDCFEANGTVYIVMEFLEGMSLKQYLAERGKMPPEQAVPVILQVAAAMEEVHKAGILHRDIAPDNIYILNPNQADTLQVKLLDFGAARYATTKHSKSLSVIIKPGYAPEEQYRSRGDQGSWTDVYALAATLYKMLTGVTPEDAMERSVKDDLKKPSRMGVKISRPMETALMNALHVKIQDRTQTMDEFARELMAAEVKERSVTKSRNDVGSVPKWIFALAGAGVTAVAVIAALILSGVIPLTVLPGSTRLNAGQVRVPNVVNKEADEAETILTENELGMSRDKMVYSDEVPQNLISYQEIKENTAVAKNTVVVVEISMGKEKRVFPTITGLKREEALKLLEEAGFTNIKEEESTEEGVYDSVLSVSEEAGDNVELDKEITITVCINEDEQGGDPSVKVEVPDVDGMTREAAKEALEKEGFRINWVEETSDEPEGTVLGQEPAAGKMANKNSFITVRVSSGSEKIYMKNVQLMSEDEARRTIEDLGLTVGNVRRAYSDSVAEGKVISQSVAQDEEVKKGDRVDLTVSRGRDPSKANAPARTQAPAPAPTEPPTTAPPPTTAAPTEPPTTAPTEPPTTAPTEPPTTAAPPPTTAAPTTAAPSDPQGIPGFAGYIPMG